MTPRGMPPHGRPLGEKPQGADRNGRVSLDVMSRPAGSEASTRHSSHSDPCLPHSYTMSFRTRPLAYSCRSRVNPSPCATRPDGMLSPHAQAAIESVYGYRGSRLDSRGTQYRADFVP